MLCLGLSDDRENCKFPWLFGLLDARKRGVCGVAHILIERRSDQILSLHRIGMP